MSESDEHRELVKSMADMLLIMEPTLSVFSDHLSRPGEKLPPNIDGCRPDVYARNHEFTRVFICEAKTFRDLKTERSSQQLLSFLEHLENKDYGVLILGVMGHATADQAKTILRFICQEYHFSKCHIRVFDGLDYWELDNTGHYLWRLT